MLPPIASWTLRVGLGSVLLMLTAQDSLASDYETARLELVGCQPDGIINAWRERWDPKEFWIEQAVVFKITIERWNLAGNIQGCQSESSQAERANCVLYMQNRYNAVRKCLAHGNTLCRMYGGC
jgi:hypothetical protein